MPAPITRSRMFSRQLSVARSGPDRLQHWPAVRKRPRKSAKGRAESGNDELATTGFPSIALCELESGVVNHVYKFLSRHRRRRLDRNASAHFGLRVSIAAGSRSFSGAYQGCCERARAVPSSCGHRESCGLRGTSRWPCRGRYSVLSCFLRCLLVKRRESERQCRPPENVDRLRQSWWESRAQGLAQTS